MKNKRGNIKNTKIIIKILLKIEKFYKLALIY